MKTIRINAPRLRLLAPLPRRPENRNPFRLRLYRPQRQTENFIRNGERRGKSQTAAGGEE